MTMMMMMMMMIRRSRRSIEKATALRTVLCDFNSNLLLIFLRWLRTNKSKVLIAEICCIENVMIAVERILTNKTLPFQFNQNREKLLIVSENWRRWNQSKLTEVNDLSQSAAVCVTKTDFISLVSSDEDKGWKFPWNIFPFINLSFFVAIFFQLVYCVQLIFLKRTFSISTK